MSCKICGRDTVLIGEKWGSFKRQPFLLRRCRSCGFSFVANPWRDYALIYSEEYYRGVGSDPTVDYQFELEHPEETIRQYEWRGVLATIQSLVPADSQTRWLDFGCGNGGLVRYCRSRGLSCVTGFEEGAIARAALASGVDLVDMQYLNAHPRTFDVVTAIEVLEHLEQPLDMLRTIRNLLKPGGLFFYTTGNAKPHRKRLLKWSYAIPEVHLSLFEPETLRYALQKVGLTPDFRGYLPGHTDIIHFKILKNLRLHRPPAWDPFIPWELVGRGIDRLFQISAHPIGWAPA